MNDQNGWAERDDAHYRNEERYEAREAMRDAHIDALIDDLIAIGQAYRVTSETERQQRDEAMESAFDWIFSHPDKQTLFETALLQIWATYRGQADGHMSRLANVIDFGITAFAGQKAKEKYR